MFRQRGKKREANLRRVRSENAANKLSQKIEEEVLNQRAELKIITAQVLRLQYELSRLHQKNRDMFEEHIWSLRYGRRLVILSNLLLGFWFLAFRIAQAFRTRSIRTSHMSRMLIPERKAPPLSVILTSGVLDGVQSSLCCFTCVFLQWTATTALKRNSGFVLSSLYSLLIEASWKDFPPMLNRINLLANVIYIFARYWFLHGLLSFREFRFL